MREMDSKRNKSAPTDEELLAQFEDLGSRASAAKATKPSAPNASTTQTSVSSQAEKDLLAELDELASQRPATPSLKSSTVAVPGTKSPKRLSSGHPIAAARSSGELPATDIHPRGPDDYVPSLPQKATTHTPQASRESETNPAEATDTGSRWWGGLLSTASAAVGQAHAAVKEIQKGEEAKRWAGQMRDNVGALKGLGGDIRSLALPTFENILQTIAPPISSHERLQIHITHDLSGYPTLDPLIYSVFSRVMSQVEGGDLMVIQKGKEASPRRANEHVSSEIPVSGWSDGPWWRTSDKRSINAVTGAVEGSKLARAGAESYASDHFASRGGVQEAAKQATEALSESNPTRTSDIFLAIQAISQPSSKDLFVAGSSSEQEDSAVKEVEETTKSEETMFAVYLHDPIHGMAFHALSQAVPSQWLYWLDADNSEHDGPPESIAEIMSSGGVDPREWVAEWIEELLTLVVGVVAQRYVARRMGVGEGGVGKGKMKAGKNNNDMVKSGGGEAARAIGGM